jgi:hypothetical protein
MHEWKIQSRSHDCGACGRRFADKQPYHTVLSEEKGEFRRLDVCAPCWTAQYGEGAADRRGFVSYWQGVYEAPPPAAPEPIQKENAESLLRKVIELNEPRYAAVAFILAVMLERKRILKVKEQWVREGQRIFIYDHPRSGDVFTIPDPNLRLDQLDQVQRDVADLLERGELPPVDAPALALATSQAEPASPSEAGADTIVSDAPLPEAPATH